MAQVELLIVTEQITPLSMEKISFPCTNEIFENFEQAENSIILKVVWRKKKADF